jgi:hypothetical protein
MKNKLQYMYKYSVILAGMFSIVGLLAFFLFLLEKPFVSHEAMKIFVSSVVLIYLLLNLAIRLLTREPLQFPFSKRFQHIISILTIVFFVATAAYGFYSWPYAPLKKVDSFYEDKTKHRYTFQEYTQFKTWEFALLAFGLPFALVAITSAPSDFKFTRKKG